MHSTHVAPLFQLQIFHNALFDFFAPQHSIRYALSQEKPNNAIVKAFSQMKGSTT